MNSFFNKIVKFAKKLMGYFPSPLPVGMTEFESWAASIADLYDLESIADMRSIRYALSTMIISSGEVSAYMPKRKFALMVRTGAAKQIAGAVFQDIQAKHKAEVAAAQAGAKAKQLAEATASQVADVDQPLQN